MFDSDTADLLPGSASARIYHGAMPGPASAVAAEIRRRIPGVGTVQLHKLLYYAQGHHLAATEHPLFGEAISAWDHGPVVASFWHDVKEHGLDSVLGTPAAQSPLDEAALNTIGYVVSRYGGMTGRDLIALSHTEPPWVEADSQRRPGTSQRITNESLASFFATNQGDEDAEALVDSDALSALIAGAEDRGSREVAIDSLDDIHRALAALRG